MLRDENDFVELTGPAVFKDERKPAYLNPDGADRPLISPVPAATLDQARRYRLERLRMKMREWDCGALLLYDPVNIRYAFDSSNMSIWTMHNPSRYALILADGPHQTGNPGADHGQVRGATGQFPVGRDLNQTMMPKIVSS